MTRDIYIGELVQDAKLAVKFPVFDASFRITVVHQVFNMFFMAFDRWKIRNDAHNRDQDQNHPDAHVNDVI